MGGLQDWRKPGGVATCPPRTPVIPGAGETLIRGWAVGELWPGRRGVVTFCHAVQYHVDEDVGASPSCTVTERGDGDRLSLGPSRNRKERGRLVELLGLAGDGGGMSEWRMRERS